MSSRKRSRDDFYRKVAPKGAVVVYKAPTSRKRRRFTPGRDRVGGFYGRYAGAGAELKFHDVEIDDAIVSATGTVQNAGTVNVIPQGVTEVQRVGRKCTIRSIHWRFSADKVEVNNAATPDASEVIRIILYLDKQCNGATIAVTDLLETATHRSFRNLANSGRFSILMDKTVSFNNLTWSYDTAGSQGDSAEVVREMSFNKTGCAIPLEFSSTTGAIAEIRSNNIGVLLISKAGTGGFASSMRLRFSDS